jgi:hypothetical protein
VFSGLRPRAILIGVVVDHLSTLLSSLALIVVLAAEHSVDLEEGFSDEAIEALVATPEFLLWSFILGMLCTALGGYVGARRAACHHIRHGAFVALASLLIGLLFYLLPPGGEPAPLWYDLLGLVIAIPSGVAGGWIALQVSLARGPTN